MTLFSGGEGTAWLPGNAAALGFLPCVFAAPDAWLRRSVLVELAKEVGGVRPDGPFLEQRFSCFQGETELSGGAAVDVALRIGTAFEAPEGMEGEY